MAPKTLTRITRLLLERAAQQLKGPDYRLDPELPLSALFGIARRRIASLLRGGARARSTSSSRLSPPFLGRDVELRNRRLITIGRGVTIGRGAAIDGLSRHGVHIGDNVTIGPYAIIEATGVVSDLGHGCFIGNRSALGSGSFVGAAGGVWIGEDVIMGNRVNFHSENHVFDDTSRPIREQGVTRQGIRIEDDCWVGGGVTFLDGAHVGRGCVVAAGSVVRGEVPPYSVIAGVPAKVIRSRLESSGQSADGGSPGALPASPSEAA